MKTKDKQIWAEMARRKLQFHQNENYKDIKLWGLFNYGFVSHLVKSGQLLTDYKKENKIIWVRPSEEAYHKFIKPLLNRNIDFLTKEAGW